MGGELEPVVGLYHAIVFILTASWADLSPYVERVVHLVIIVFAIVWTWKKIKAIK
jgi:hypothetical protein